MAERYWEDETDPRELRRRAKDIERDGLHAMAKLFRDRADEVERQRSKEDT